MTSEQQDKISEAANRLGAWVASQAGATPHVEKEVLDKIVSHTGAH